MQTQIVAYHYSLKLDELKELFVNDNLAVMTTQFGSTEIWVGLQDDDSLEKLVEHFYITPQEARELHFKRVSTIIFFNP